MSDKLEFYFSFRSPYSWLALYRINLVMDELPVEIQLIPVFPAKDKDDVMLSNQDKVKYITKDIVRITTAYGLKEIHKAGVIHRDLKPANIMFRGDDSLALADFGISKKMNSASNLTTLGQIIGTPH